MEAVSLMHVGFVARVIFSLPLTPSIFKGIAPFIPPKLKDRSFLGNLLLWSLCPVLLPIKLIAILLCALLLLPFIALASILGIVFGGTVERLVWLSLCSPILRLILLLMGFYWVNQSTVFTSQLRKSQREKCKQRSVDSGDVILLNHVSYVDVIWLAYRYAPVFTSVPNAWKGEEGEDEGLLIRRSLIGALFDVFTHKQHGVEEAIPTDTLLNGVRQRGLGPVVVFPEGATSNGSAILQCVSCLSKTRSKSAVHIIGLKYDSVGYSPAFSCGGIFTHVLQLMLQPINTLNVYCLASTQTPSMGEFNDVELVEQTLAKVLRLKTTDLTSGDKQEFLRYYDDIQSGKGYQSGASQS